MPDERSRWRDWPEPMTVAMRRRKAERRAADLARKHGRDLAPVVVAGREITETFWGDAWCDNLEHYSDFANRLPRGRSYLRNGSLIDLRIDPGRVTALVSGTDLYTDEIAVAPVPRRHWQAICRDAAGAIDSVVELLQGRLSTSVMSRLCRAETGLFPTPAEIQLSCTCPDRATMCKHVAAVLYGIGARLDREPALLFTLRKVNEAELIARAGSGSKLGRRRPVAGTSRRIDDASALGAIFGLDIAPARRGRRRKT